MQTLFLKAENSFLPGKFSLVNSCSSLVMDDNGFYRKL